MKKFVRRSLIWSSLFIFFVFLLLVAFAALFGDAIGMRLLKELNKQFLTELTAEEVSLSLVADFPSATAQLQGVSLESAIKNQPLLEAEELKLRLSIWSLFDDNLRIQAIQIKNGSVAIVQSDAKGLSNLNFIDAGEKPADSLNPHGNFTLAVDQAILDNVELLYLDAQARKKIRTRIEKATISGRLKQDRLYLDTDADFYSKYVEIDGTRYGLSKNISVKAEVDIHLKTALFKIDKATIGIDGTEILVGGWIKESGSGLSMDLNAQSAQGSVGAVLDLLPPAKLQSLAGLESTGKFQLDVSAKGRFSKYSMPEITGRISLEKGNISTDLLDHPLKNVSFVARYSNGKDRSAKTSLFELQSFEGYFNREWIEGELSISDFDNAFVNLAINGILPLETLVDFLPHPSITGSGGELEFRNLSIKGRYEDMLHTSRISRIDMSGSVVFDDALLEVNTTPLLLDRGELSFDGNTVIVKDVHFEGPNTDFRLEATATNLLPVLLADSMNSRQAELKFDARLNASSLDFDKMTSVFERTSEKIGISAAGADSLPARLLKKNNITKLLNGEFEGQIDEFSYGRISGKSFKGNLKIQDSELTVGGTAEAMGGVFEIEAKGYLEIAPVLHMQLICKDMDVNELFAQTNNFGQQFITSSHLAGTLAAHCAVDAFWDENGNFLYEKLRVLSDISIRDGELRDFELLYDYSDYVDISELRHIRFTTLQNWLEISDGRIFIPVMFVQSTALNLTLGGEHTFDHAIDYYIKVNAGQVLSEKLRSKRSTTQMVPAKRKDWFNLYMHLYGHIDAFAHENDSRTVKAWFESSDRRKENIQRKLMEIFGPVISLEEPVGWKDAIPEYREEEEPGQIDYLDGIDSNGGKKSGENERE